MAGRSPRYKTPAEMQVKIDEYFDRCLTEAKPPTMCGLALHLGFTSRQTLLNYKAKRPFVDIITRARSRVEQYSEERLYDRDGQRGAEFNLRCNFGWSDRPDTPADTDKLDAILAEVRKNAAER